MSGRESVYDWVCRCGVRNRVYVKVCGGCGFSDTGEAVAHANGAYSCIAHALGGGEDADDFWYEQAHNVLDALKRKEFVAVKATPAGGVRCDCHERLRPGYRCSSCDPQEHSRGGKGVSAEVRDFLAAVAEQHRPYGLDCKCGRPINSDADWAAHIAGVLDTSLGDLSPELNREVKP